MHVLVPILAPAPVPSHSACRVCALTQDAVPLRKGGEWEGGAGKGRLTWPALVAGRALTASMIAAKATAKNEAENGHEDKQRVDRATRLSHGYL